MPMTLIHRYRTKNVNPSLTAPTNRGLKYRLQRGFRVLTPDLH